MPKSNTGYRKTDTEEILEDEFRTVLATVDRQGRRKWVYVDIPKGFWRRLKRYSAIFLIGIYLVTPFISIGGEPLLRIDIPDRRYVFFGYTFWPQDMFYGLLFFLIFLFSTILAVSLVGRVFCGWLCPHNVFLEMVFRPIEVWLEGRAARRRHNDKIKPGGAWRGRKILKYVLYVLICGALANTATAIFVDKSAFLYGFLINPIDHPAAAMFFAFFFGACLFNFLWFREQTCTIVCPYGRLQAALLDPHSLTVAYDPNRGEPRGKLHQGETFDGRGDCIDCYRCVSVCPTGIDIRNGIQLECINCTACIDACDDVMDRVGRPKGLIRFSSENELAGQPRKVLRGRNLVYGLVLTVLCTVLIVLLLNRQPIEINLLRETIPAQEIAATDDEPAKVIKVVNFAIVNKTAEPQTVRVWVEAGSGIALGTGEQILALPPQAHIEDRAFVHVPATAFEQDQQIFRLYIGNEAVERMIPIALQRPGP